MTETRIVWCQRRNEKKEKTARPPVQDKVVYTFCCPLASDF